MKEFFLIFSLFLFPIIIYAQTQEEPELGNSGQIVHDKKDASVSLSPNLVFDTPNGRTFAGGFKLRTFVGKNFSFDSDFLVGRDFMQFSPGIFGVMVLILGYDWSFGPGEGDNSFMEFLLTGISVLLAAEHFSFHIPVTNNTEISPYVSFLRIRSFTTAENSVKGKSFESTASFAAGLEVNRYFNRFILSPYVDYSIGYSRPIHGFSCGINFGYYFPSR